MRTRSVKIPKNSKIVFSLSVEDAFEFAEAVKIARQVRANRIIHPKKAEITIETLRKAFQEANIDKAELYVEG